MSDPLNVPATIDLIHRQLDEARDIESVLEIHDRAEALREYCRRHDGLMEAGNRLAGITALCERRIGQELRVRERPPPGPAPKDASTNVTQPPTLDELGFEGSKGRMRAAAYQELAHPDVAENVILDAIAEAGKEGRFASKTDIRRAVRTEIERKRAERGESPKPAVDPDLRAAADQWNADALVRVRWSPVLQALEAMADLEPPRHLFNEYYEPFEFALRRVLPKAEAWLASFKEEWDARQRLRDRGDRRLV